jgi:hypothetical protein
MQRRKFLLISMLASTFSGVLLPGCHGRNPDIVKTLGLPGSLAEICDEKTILEIGKGYLSKFPSEANRNKLTDLLLTQADGREFSDVSSGTTIMSFLEEKTKQDFRAGRTVILSGWILSATESRQSALLFLIKNQ